MYQLALLKNGVELKATKMGDIKLSNNITLKNVLYLPELKNKLLSLTQIANAGHIITMTKDKITIKTKANC